MKFINRLALVVAPVVALVGGSAHAAMDLTPITGAFTAGDVTAAVIVVGGTLALVYATIKAARIALGMIRGS